MTFRTTDTAARNRARIEGKHESVTRQRFDSVALKQEQPLTPSEAKDDDAKHFLSGFPPSLWGGQQSGTSKSQGTRVVDRV